MDSWHTTKKHKPIGLAMVDGIQGHEAEHDAPPTTRQIRKMPCGVHCCTPQGKKTGVPKRLFPSRHTCTHIYCNPGCNVSRRVTIIPARLTAAVTAALSPTAAPASTAAACASRPPSAARCGCRSRWCVRGALSSPPCPRHRPAGTVPCAPRCRRP